MNNPLYDESRGFFGKPPKKPLRRGPVPIEFSADLVKQKVDLDDYLTNHLNCEIVSDGPGREAALCPFHEEDTPSFKIFETDSGWKRWRCFGACDEGGSVIDEAMKAEGFEIGNDAVRYLNEIYNLGLDTKSAAYRAWA